MIDIFNSDELTQNIQNVLLCSGKRGEILLFYISYLVVCGVLVL